MKFIFFIIIFFCLSSCGLKFPNLELKFEEKRFFLECDNQNFTLLVSNNGRNFSLFDSLFTPIVSRNFMNSKFTNAKFLPPSSKYDELFYEILKMIKEDKKYHIYSGKKLFCKVNEI
ncbi:hypothetical protein F1B92_05910 [Campylobacter sp. FMV-PI01]|uniref:Uncharacterized protein n=1 Tax=Campylobacter portucalensis TaxID=2608384 RepID=A0A6L5WHJ3_9BACT|nr:hypothetical protein [Campylobacter portucalensis]